MVKQTMLFGVDTQLERLSKLGDPLEKINAVIDWEAFRPTIREIVRKADYSKGGRPPIDEILMFKITLLQDWNNISDPSAEYMVNCRIDWQRFLGMELGEKAPDANTIWLFKEQLGKDGVRKLFDLFNKRLSESGIVKRDGSLVDASFVDVPKQRNTREENLKIKQGETPEEWTTDAPAAKHKRAQKDTDARWAVKGNETHYGYKNHVKVDKKSKIIVEFSVTGANVHDSNEFHGLLDSEDNKVWADSAYGGEEIEREIKKEYPDIELYICEKGERNNPLTPKQKKSNRKKSKVRARVEHVFGYIARFMGGMTIRSIGIERAEREICGMNLAYNIKRAVFLAAAA